MRIRNGNKRKRKIMAGKGDRTRPTDESKYRDNYDDIFGKKKPTKKTNKKKK